LNFEKYHEKAMLLQHSKNAAADFKAMRSFIYLSKIVRDSFLVKDIAENLVAGTSQKSLMFLPE